MARASTCRSSTITPCRSARRGSCARAGTSPWSAIRSASASRSTRRRSSPSEGIDAEVIDLRTLRPLDKATVLASLAKTNRMVCVEEGWPVCSISAELIAVAMEEGFDDLDAPVLRVTDEDVPLALCRQSREARADQGRRRRRRGEEGAVPLTQRPSDARPRSRPPPRSRLCPGRARARRWRRSGVLTSLWARCSPPAASRWSSRIRLAWWREALERLDRERAAGRAGAAGARRACPARRVERRRAGGDGGGVGDAARRRPLSDELEAYAAARGGLLFRFSARLLGDAGLPVEQAGEALGAGRSRPPQRRPRARPGRARGRGATRPRMRRWPPPLRPLGMLAVLAAARSRARRRPLGNAGRAGADAADDPPSAHRQLMRFR